MRNIKAIIFSVLCVTIVALIGVEVFAAVVINVQVKGRIEYTAMDIGAQILGTYALNTSAGSGTAQYLTFSGSGTTTNNIYTESGEEYAYSNITASVGSQTFSSGSDELEIYIFVKNTGARYIVPSITITKNSNDILVATSAKYFDVSANQIDPITKKSNFSTASAFISSVKTTVSGGGCQTFASNASLDNNDVYMLVASVTLKDSIANGGMSVDASFTINISFACDVIYTSDNVLSVYQEQNKATRVWTKYGYNATLDAVPTKLESNSATYLQEALTNKNATTGNANITYGGLASTGYADVYSEIAPVYKDIDLVNVDIATGEIIGKLSNPNYNFEWFGRTITLPAGTVLASGRTLTSSQSFTVDVYTYYPTMYVRRWVVGNIQWLSVSDSAFQGAVKIDAYYTATFEATMFDADKKVAYNDYGIIPRSYVYNHTPITSGSVNYLMSYYNYSNPSSYTATEATTQANMLKWCSNLTKAWEAYKTANPTFNYTTATSVGGEDFTVYVYNILYLVKYANNDSQETVGYGNTYTYALYYNTQGTTITTDNGTAIVTGQNGYESPNSNYARWESEKGGGTIGFYNSNSAQQNSAKMAYGYQSTYQNGTDKAGLYSHQFLTYNNGTKRYLCDGYVGSDMYTSVFCLGQCNPWGNVWTWVFGSAVVSDDVSVYAYINFEHYDYVTSNYVLATGSVYSNNVTALENKGYVKLSYTLPDKGGWYNYLGTSAVTTESGLASLVGLPTSASSTNSGLADYYWVNNTSAYLFGVLRGGSSWHSTNAGACTFGVDNALVHASSNVGLRVSLTP